eukprot:gene22446-biopygen4238
MGVGAWSLPISHMPAARPGGAGGVGRSRRCVPHGAILSLLLGTIFVTSAPSGSRFRSLGRQFRHVCTSGPEVRLARDLAPAAPPTGADRAYRPGPPAPTRRASGANRQADYERLTPKAQRK